MAGATCPRRTSQLSEYYEIVSKCNLAFRLQYLSKKGIFRDGAQVLQQRDRP